MKRSGLKDSASGYTSSSFEAIVTLCLLTDNQVMLLDQGRIAEFDKPAVLLADSSSKFHSLCKATGKSEFAMLKKMAGVP